MPTPLLCILIVEDDPEINRVIRELLADEAIAAISATSLAEARHHLATSNILGVVLDYSLPDGTGDQLLDDLAGSAYAPGVVLATAHPDGNAIAKRYGIPVIRKPLDLDVLLAAVRVFIEGKGKATNLPPQQRPTVPKMRRVRE